MKQEQIIAWASFVTGMMIAEVLGIVLRAFNLDSYSYAIVFAFYAIVIVSLSSIQDKTGDKDED